MRLVFEDQGWEDYTSWLKTDRKTLARINKLIEDILRDPFSGIGSQNRSNITCLGPGRDELMTSIASSTS